MATKFVRIGCQHFNPHYIKIITCNGPDKGCAVIIANTMTGGNGGYSCDKIVKFTCDDWSKCPGRNSDIWSSRPDK